MKKPAQTLRGTRLEKVTTDDGSVTLRRLDGATYRSTSGADSESSHVFVAPTDRAQDPIRVLELGFGVATNFSTCVGALNGRSLVYFAVENDPVPVEMCPVGGPGEVLARKGLAALVTQDHVDISDDELGVRLVLHRASWSDVDFGESVHATAVFHDPFAVSTNPEEWSQACFEWELSHMGEGAILATYGAATRVRRAMARAGLEVAIGPGFGRKREATYASNDVASLSRWEVVTNKYLRQPGRPCEALGAQSDQGEDIGS